jgi:hypothetical protein
MNATNKKYGIVAVILLTLLALSAWFFVHMRQKQGALNVNCSTILQYNHQAPNFTATLEYIFRLEKNLDGYVVISGNIHSERGGSRSFPDNSLQLCHEQAGRDRDFGYALYQKCQRHCG